MWNNKLPEQEYLEKYPNATLKEYLDYQKQKKDDEYKDAREIEENNKQWIIDNLVGKNVLFRYQGAFYIMKPEIGKYNDIITNVLYHFGEVDNNRCNSDFTENIYRLHKTTKGTHNKNIDWIKSPFDVYKYCVGTARFPAYIISDEKMNEILEKLNDYTKFYKELTEFEKNDWAIKVE